MADFASKGVAGAGLGLGIAGTALGLARGGLGSLLGGLGWGNGYGWGNGWGNGYGCNGGGEFAAGMLAASALEGGRHGRGGECSENTPVTRFDLEQAEKLADKQARIDQLEGSQETDRKILELYRHIDSRFEKTGETIAQIASAQAVTNQRVSDDLRFVQADLDNKIAAERQQRCCADQNIVNYANQTFYAKLVAGVTPTADTTPQSTYNPLPCCGGNGGCCGDGR